VTDTDMPEAASPDHRARRVRSRQPPPAPAPADSSVVVPVVGLLAFIGLIGIGFLVAASRRQSAPLRLPHLPSMPHVPAVPSLSSVHMPPVHMPAMPHLPSFDMRWIGRLAMVSAAQAAVTHLVQSAMPMRTWK
jgi:hypothetical protein